MLSKNKLHKKKQGGVQSSIRSSICFVSECCPSTTCYLNVSVAFCSFSRWPAFLLFVIIAIKNAFVSKVCRSRDWERFFLPVVSRIDFFLSRTPRLGLLLAPVGRSGSLVGACRVVACPTQVTMPLHRTSQATCATVYFTRHASPSSSRPSPWCDGL